MESAESFVHRNLANVVGRTAPSLLSVVQFAVEPLVGELRLWDGLMYSNSRLKLRLLGDKCASSQVLESECVKNGLVYARGFVLQIEFLD